MCQARSVTARRYREALSTRRPAARRETRNVTAQWTTRFLRSSDTCGNNWKYYLIVTPLLTYVNVNVVNGLYLLNSFLSFSRLAPFVLLKLMTTGRFPPRYCCSVVSMNEPSTFIGDDKAAGNLLKTKSRPPLALLCV